MRKIKIFLYSFVGISLLSCVAGTQESSVDANYVLPGQIIEILTPSTALYYNASCPATINFSGTCSEEGQSFKIKIGSQVIDTIDCITNQFSYVLDTSKLSEGVNNINFVAQSGNIASTNVTLDTTLPTVSFQNVNTVNQSNQGAYSIEGICSENGQTITGSFDVLPFSTTCTNNTWSSPVMNLSFYVDATYVATVAIDDAAGNASTPVTANILKDTTTPLPSLSFVTPSNGYGNSNSVIIRVGSITATDTIVAYDNPGCTNNIQTQVAVGTSHDLTFNPATEGSHKYYFIVTDTVPNSSPCLGPIIFIEDQTNPTNPLTATLSSPGAGESSNDSTPVVAGTISASEEGSTVYGYRDSGCSDEVGSNSVSSGAFSILGSLAVDGSHNGVNQFYLKVADKAGNLSGCYDTGLSYTLGGGGLAALPKLAMVGNDSPSMLVSLEDANTITWTRKADPGNPIILGTFNRGDLVSIEDPGNAADKVDQGDLIESTGACYVVTQGFGTAPWASDAYAGKIYSTHQYRYGEYSPKVYVAAISQTSFVQILQDTDNDGDLDVVDYQNIAAGSVHEFTINLTNNRPWQIVGTENINAYYVAKSSGGGAYDKDARVLTPAAKDIVGFSAYITSIENGTNVNAYQNRNVAVYTATLNVNQTLTTQRTVKGAAEQYAMRVIADKPVSQLQIADGDGTNASPHLPVSYLATVYGIPRAADYVGIITLGAATVDVYNPNGTFKVTRTLSKTAGANVLAPYAYRYTDGGSVPAGTTFECSAPCFMMYDDEGVGADRDETIMMGYTP